MSLLNQTEIDKSLYRTVKFHDCHMTDYDVEKNLGFFEYNKHSPNDDISKIQNPYNSLQEFKQYNIKNITFKPAEGHFFPDSSFFILGGHYIPQDYIYKQYAYIPWLVEDKIHDLDYEGLNVQCDIATLRTKDRRKVRNINIKCKQFELNNSFTNLMRHVNIYTNKIIFNSSPKSFKHNEFVKHNNILKCNTMWFKRLNHTALPKFIDIIQYIKENIEEYDKLFCCSNVFIEYRKAKQAVLITKDLEACQHNIFEDNINHYDTYYDFNSNTKDSYWHELRFNKFELLETYKDKYNIYCVLHGNARKFK